MTVVPRATEATNLDTWEFSVRGSDSWSTVRLPHDAMIHEQRRPDAAGGADIAYYPGGRYIYRTTWRAEKEAAPFVALRFEGVQGEATVSVNDSCVGSIRSGYTEFELPITEHVHWGADNVVVVEVDNSAQPASRWYPGSGLYRGVSLVVRPEFHFAADGLQLRTKVMTAEAAIVEVSYDLVNADGREALIAVDLLHAGEVVATGTSAGSTGTLVLRVENPYAWSAETPCLYEIVARLELGGAVVDERRERVGLRTISVDAHHGLRINGAPVLLRGACIHHDNGVLGAATHRAAEYRRVRLLKEAGFNAIRSAHNPMSRHLLDACDEIGVYVLDELADYWVISKTKHDAAGRFREIWREDADRMVEKDRNRPSVIMYAAGNEIPETAKPEGVTLTREITEYLHRLDPDRPVTLATNLFLSTLVSMDKSPYKETPPAEGETSMAGSTEANVMINQIGRMMDLVSRLPQADKASRDAFAEVDVAGYNYGLGRYKGDLRRYPDRVILGSETLPSDVARAWQLVQENPAVIGDFVWAGWEYLGEAGVAVWVPGKRAGLSKPFPYLIAGPGMFDLTGQPDITLRLAQAAWGRLEAPAIGVRPLDRSGVPMVRSAWRTTDAVESWSWRGCEGRKAAIEVYSADDHVALFLNGRRIGRRRAGRRRGYVAKFTVPYEPGTLTVVGYRNGSEVSRTVLRSAEGQLGLRITSATDEVDATGDELIFADIAVTDLDGVPEMLADEQVVLHVTGPGELIGYGTAAPASEEEFTGDTRTTFRGRALAVIRPNGKPGPITITAHSQTLGRAGLVVHASTTVADGPSDLVAAALTH
jgi:beta-galactosidase